MKYLEIYFKVLLEKDLLQIVAKNILLDLHLVREYTHIQIKYYMNVRDILLQII